jgi:diguanylate cyclase
MRVLLIEERRGFAALVAALLEEAAPAEFRVEVSATPDAAVDRLLDDGIDAVLLDGIRTLERVHAAALGRPVIVLSPVDDDAVALGAIRAGAQECVPRDGIDGRTLVRALRHGVERHRREARLAHRALHDPLTGLPNRALFFDRLRLALSRLQRTQTCLAVLFLDLDDFKSLNDALGHAAGDQFLVEVAHRLRGGLRGGDTAARLGGDEFLVLCEDVAGLAEVRSIADRIVAELPGSVSVGVTLAVDGDEDPEQLVRSADAAMYVCKRCGGGRIEVAVPTPRAA